jgi:hypothetical protein
VTDPNRSNGQDRLLVGEDPATKSRVEATRWVRVYSDLLRAKDSLMADLEASMARSRPEASLELGQVDGGIFVAQRARYERRLAFWEQREGELVRH